MYARIDFLRLPPFLRCTTDGPALPSSCCGRMVYCRLFSPCRIVLYILSGFNDVSLLNLNFQLFFRNWTMLLLVLHFYCFLDFVLFTICTRHSTVLSLVVSYHGGAYQSRPPLQHLESKLQMLNPLQGTVFIDWRTDTTETIDGNGVTPFVCVCAEKGKSISSESTRGA